MSEALERRLAARRRAELVSSLRQLARPGSAAGRTNGAPGNGGGPASETCDLCGNEIPPDHRHVLQLTERRILCVCESCLALRSGDPELRPSGTRVVWLDDFELSDELWARFQIPIGLAFFLRDSAAGRVVALYPSPAGATESELDLDAWERARSRQSSARRPRGGRRGADRQPDGRAAAARNRADRRVLPAGRHDQGELGGNLGRRRAGGGDRGLLRRAAGEERELGERPAGKRPGHVRRGAGRRGAAGPADARVRGRWACEPVERAAAPTLRFRVRATTFGPAGLHDRAIGADHDRARQAHLRPRDARAAGGAVRRARAVGDHDHELSLDPGRRARARASPAARSSTSRSPAPTTSRSPRPSTSTGSRTATCRFASTSTGRSSTRASTGPCSCCRSRGTARFAIRCRSRPGGR